MRYDTLLMATALFAAAGFARAEPEVHYNHDLRFALTPLEYHVFTGVQYYDHTFFHPLNSPEENRDGTTDGPSVYCELRRDRFTGSETAYDAYLPSPDVVFGYTDVYASYYTQNYQVLNTLLPGATIEDDEFLEPDWRPIPWVLLALEGDPDFPYMKIYGDDLYAGIKIDILGETHYGYVRFRWSTAEFATTQEAQDVLGVGETREVSYHYPIEWGYETEPDTPMTIPLPPCPADTNLDGDLTPADFTAWLDAFNNNAPTCEQNGDGMCSPADFTAWINNFNSGC